MPKIRSASLSRQFVDTCEMLLEQLYAAGGTMPAATLRREDRAVRHAEWNRDSLLKALTLVGAIEQMGQRRSAQFVLTQYGFDLLSSYRNKK